MLTLIELHYKFWKWHNLQRSLTIEHFFYREHEISKGGPPNYDVMIWWRSPRHAPHSWGRWRRFVFELPCACIGEKSDGHTMFSFVIGNSTGNAIESWILVRMHMANERYQLNSHNTSVRLESQASNDIGKTCVLSMLSYFQSLH